MSFLETIDVPLISFRYGGKGSGDLLPRWQTEVCTVANTRGKRTHRTFTCPATGLKVTTHAQRVDTSVPIPPAERLTLHHANGSACRMDDFLPQSTDLRPKARKSLTPNGGRSSNGAFPFMNLQRKDCGLVLAVGWSGQWTAIFERETDSVRIAAGMERTHLRLHPGERIRIPRILVLPWEGDDAETGNNLLRSEWWEAVGSWDTNRERFPHGLRPISDAVHQAGMKFVLWFEPERVRQDSLLHREHPEFLLACEENRSNLLVNLGMPEARQHITDLISMSISENGVDIYRQDLNLDPLPYWQAADSADRVGITEIRYVEGHYAFWDELRRRHPRLWIDNCASGGRRIDLETLSRSLPLWPSDFPDVCGLPFGQGLHVGDQCINAGLARWVPLFGGGAWNFTPYGTRSEIVGGFTFGFHIDHGDFPSDDNPSIVDSNDVLVKGRTLLNDDFPVSEAQAAIREWESVRPFFLGNFYLLLPLTVSYHDWCAWQFHRNDMDAGFAMFFRRHRSLFPTMEVGLKCVGPDVQYEVSLSSGYEEARRKRMTGRQLSRISIVMSEKPGSLLLRYTQIQ